MKRHSPKALGKRNKKKKDFYDHLRSYVGVNFFLFVLNALTAFGDWWFYWPMMGWGIGLFFHFMDTFGLPFVNEPDENQGDRLDLEDLERGSQAEPIKTGRQQSWREEDLV
jgi:hypothetical protein